MKHASSLAVLPEDTGQSLEDDKRALTVAFGLDVEEVGVGAA